jgi:hypothetical protein
MQKVDKTYNVIPSAAMMIERGIIPYSNSFTELVGESSLGVKKNPHFLTMNGINFHEAIP